MSFKDISYLELWWPFCSAEQNHLSNFGRGYPRVGISGTTAKSRKHKLVPSSHPGPFRGSGIVTEKPNKGKYSRLF